MMIMGQEVEKFVLRFGDLVVSEEKETRRLELKYRCSAELFGESGSSDWAGVAQHLRYRSRTSPTQAPTRSDPFTTLNPRVQKPLSLA